MANWASINPAGGLAGFFDDSIAPPPAGAVELTPAQYSQWLGNQHGFIWQNGALVAVAPSLATVQAAQVSTLTKACAAAIIGGFSSLALGTAHTYPSAPTDQANLSAAAMVAAVNTTTAGWTATLWCSAGGVWSFTPHTAAQVQQVMSDWLAWRTAKQSELIGLKGQVAAATTAAGVQGITWS